MSQTILRSVRRTDEPGMRALAHILNTMNLPSRDADVAELVDLALGSFTGAVADPFERDYLLVLEHGEIGTVVGSSRVIAQHGTRDAPHVYFDLYEDARYSKSIDKLIHHQVLRLGYDYRGRTEIGGLVLLPQHRRSPDKLGRFLSYGRFLLMGMYREGFRERVIAELMPPLLPDGASALWNALGKQLTGMEYLEADYASRKNKEFIKSLFPETPIYLSFLPPEVRAVVGQVGEASRSAAYLLGKTGFRYSGRVDPFDGGPHFECPTDEIVSIRQLRRGCASIARTSVEQKSCMDYGIVALWKYAFTPQASFVATQTKFYWDPVAHTICVPEQIGNLLEIDGEDRIAAWAYPSPH